MSMRATQPLRMRTPAPPLPVMSRPRNWKRFGLWPTYEHVLTVCILPEEFLEICVRCTEVKRRTHLDLAFIPEFVADKLGGLKRTLQRAGNNDIRLDFQGAEHAPHDHALLFAFCDETPLRVELNALAGNSSIGMAHKVQIHGREAGVSGRVEPLPSKGDFNTLVTFFR